MAITLGEIAETIGGELYGDASLQVIGIATLENAKSNQLSFLSNRRYIKQLSSTQAGAVIIADDHLSRCPCPAIVVDDPYLGYAMAARKLYPEYEHVPSIASTASIDKNATIDPTACIGANAVIEAGVEIHSRVFIGPGVVIQSNATIGSSTRIMANSTICQSVVIGSNVLIHPGVIIGSDGFGLAEESDGSWLKIPQIGTVIIEDNVEIGANTTIDRGALEDTCIGKGVKIDNQVQIGHNVRIGEFTAIAGCTGIAGSATIGSYCRIGGGCGISGHLEITDNVLLTGMSAVNNSITKPGIYSSPLSVTDNRTWRKNVARFHKLDDSFRKIREEIRQLKHD